MEVLILISVVSTFCCHLHRAMLVISCIILLFCATNLRFLFWCDLSILKTLIEYSPNLNIHSRSSLSLQRNSLVENVVQFVDQSAVFDALFLLLTTLRVEISSHTTCLEMRQLLIVVFCQHVYYKI